MKLPRPEFAERSDFAGEVERIDADGTIEGWCEAPAGPGPHQGVVIVVDGHVVARAACDADAASAEQVCRFRVSLSPRVARPGAEVEIAVRVVGTGQLVDAPRRVRWSRPPEIAAEPPLPPPPQQVQALRGNLDRVTRDGWVAGWCWDPARPEARVLMEVLADEELVGTVLAADWRPDLLAAGIGDGHHGFSFALPYEVLAGAGTLRIAVREAMHGAGGGGRALGDPVALRIGLQAEGQQRMAELEREVRLMRGRMEAFVREADARAPADEHATRTLFATIAAFFQELADSGAPEARGFGVGPSVRAALDELRARLPSFAIARPPGMVEVLAVVPATAPVETVHACLAALQAEADAASLELVLVDPGDADPACALLPALLPGLSYRACAPGGLVAAVAELARESACRWLGLIDPKVRVGPGWLAALRATLAEQPEAAAAGAVVLGPDGLVWHGGFVAEAGGRLGDPAFAEEAEAAPWRKLRRVDALAPLAMLVDRAAAGAGGDAMGGLRAAFRDLGYAVAELCLRLRRQGRTVLCQPAARAAWTGDATLDPALFVPAGGPALDGPGDDARRLRLCLLETFAGAPEIGRALFVDDAMPRPDRDAGSVAAIEQMRALWRLGWRVTFAPANGEPGLPADAARLESLGIEVAAPPDMASVADLLRQVGPEFDLVWITRHANFTRLAPLARAHAPEARLLFAPADLHFLRERREAALSPSAKRSSGAAEATRQAELACAREAEATLLLSDVERRLLLEEGVDGARLHVLPWIARPAPSGAGFAEREGVLFVGGFAHKPNLDAVLWWADSIRGLLRTQRPGLVLHVVGADPPPNLLALSGPAIYVHGWVADLALLLRRVRLTVAPLRFGAGFKGKIATSLAHGVPVVATGIALEGTGLADGDGVRLADSAQAFAAAVAAVHDDAACWDALSARAIERVETMFAPARADAALRDVLRSIGLSALGSVV